MGAAYYLTLNNKSPGFDITVNGKFVSRYSDSINEIAVSLGLKDLDSYFSQSPDEAKAAAEDFGADIEGIDFPEESFFSATEGIEWATAIISEVKRKNVNGADDIISDLTEYLDIFVKIDGIGAQWHFSIDY